MHVPVSWLREYVTVNATAAEIADRLFTSAAGVDRVFEVGVPDVDGNLGRFLVGRVLAVDAHPNADRLRVCQVDVGEGDVRQIVCGAWNFEAGATVAVALPGALLPVLDQPLDERELRGQSSRGMILAEDEIGLGDEHSGIIVLPDGREPGTPLVDVLPIRDQVLDVTPTVNRVDLLSMVGVAREVATLLGGELHLPAPDDAPIVDAEDVDVTVEDFEGCPRYIGRVFQGCPRPPVAPVAPHSSAPRGDAVDLECRRRHELRHARLGEPPPRLRPGEARGRRDRRPPLPPRRGAADARRHAAGASSAPIC